jgi:hypothetical protein
MTPSISTAVGSNPHGLGAEGSPPVALSFTRFVAAHGGSNSLRAVDRLQVGQPQHAVEVRAQLTFNRRIAPVRRIGEASTREW